MEKPLLYRLVQSTLAGEGHKVIKDYLINKIPKTARKILDQGCGTGEYSLLFKGVKFYGIDNNPKDIEYAGKNFKGNFFIGSADRMKAFKSNFFDVVFAVGLHHHLNDKQACEAVNEALRVVKKKGRVIIVDAMLPKEKLNIIGLILRKLDRGRFVRRIEETLKLLPLKSRYNYRILSSFPFDYICIEISK